MAISGIQNRSIWLPIALASAKSAWGVEEPMLANVGEQRTENSVKALYVGARGRFPLPIDFDYVKVRLRNSDGKYLAADLSGWTFSTDCTKAFVFDYVGDGIEEYVKSIVRMSGVILKATPVDPKEFLETCDQCQQVVAPINAFFDGRRFLCPRCRSKLQARRSIR